jgi:hypothetical protein
MVTGRSSKNPWQIWTRQPVNNVTRASGVNPAMYVMQPAYIIRDVTFGLLCSFIHQCTSANVQQASQRSGMLLLDPSVVVRICGYWPVPLAGIPLASTPGRYIPLARTPGRYIPLARTPGQYPWPVYPWPEPLAGIPPGRYIPLASTPGRYTPGQNPWPVYTPGQNPWLLQQWMDHTIFSVHSRAAESSSRVIMHRGRKILVYQHM